MKIYQFDKEVGKKIAMFQSNFVMSKVVQSNGALHVGCMHLPENGIVGYHEAVTDQLFIVVQGEGYVCGNDKVKVPIQAGEVAFWKKGEKHESSTETGMMAIVLEGEDIKINMPMG